MDKHERRVRPAASARPIPVPAGTRRRRTLRQAGGRSRSNEGHFAIRGKLVAAIVRLCGRRKNLHNQARVQDRVARFVVGVKFDFAADNAEVRVHRARLTRDANAQVAVVRKARGAFEPHPQSRGDIHRNQRVLGRAPRHRENLAVAKFMLLRRVIFDPVVVLKRTHHCT